MLRRGNYSVYLDLSCNKYCDLIGQEEVSISLIKFSYKLSKINLQVYCLELQSSSPIYNVAIEASISKD